MATLFPQLEQDNARDAALLSARLHRAGHWSSDPHAIQAKVAELSVSSRALLAEAYAHASGGDDIFRTESAMHPAVHAKE